MARALARVRRLKIDAVVDLEYFSRASALFAWLSGAPRRVGCHRFTTEGPYRGDLMTHRIQYNPYLHTSAVYALEVDALAMDPGDAPMPKVMPPPRADDAVPRFTPDPAAIQRVQATLAAEGVQLGSGPVVLLNPNASDLMPLRRWPLDRFIELGKRILDADLSATVVVTGAPSEREPALALAQAIGSTRAVCLAGKTTLYDLMTLYTLAQVLVTNDSGPGHFAALTDIETVVLFGPETPARYGPLGARCRVIWAGLACSPCVNAFNHRFSPCNLNRCMLAITVDQVFETVRACLARR
jgi:ADP-heptose:LPS heptosyltransferase